MYSKYNKSPSKYYLIFERWSFAVPILCYLVLFCMIWILSVPLKPTINLKIPDRDKDTQKLEDTFEIKIKNSNFNSDKIDSESKILSDKNEYLVNVNNEENVHKNQADILEDVFKKYTSSIRYISTSSDYEGKPHIFFKPLKIYSFF